MKKVLKVILFVILGTVVLGLIGAGFGTIGLKEARELEIKNIDLSKVEDGEYTGAYDNTRWSNTVTVVVKDHEIVEIKQMNTGNDAQSSVQMQVIDKVIAQQKVDIDAVSGATATTNSMLKAIEDALD